VSESSTTPQPPDNPPPGVPSPAPSQDPVPAPQPPPDAPNPGPSAEAEHPLEADYPDGDEQPEDPGPAGAPG
jgi:hypothetical protein